MDDRKIMEGLDACRPGSRDHESPELASLAALMASDGSTQELRAKIERVDRGIQAAMHQPSLPSGARQRLLAVLANQNSAATLHPISTALAASAAATSPGEASLGSESDLATLPAKGAGRATRGSRRLWWSAAVAASLLVGGYGVWHSQNAQKHSPDLYATAEGWSEQLSSEWRPVGTASPAFALPEGIVGGARGWQSVGKGLGRKGVAYDLSRAGRFKATLFVMKMALKSLPTSPPLRPQSSTGGRTIGAWRGRDMVYVLVVQGDQQRYRSLISGSSPPLARASTRRQLAPLG